jgi:phosphoenolpyruvate phosphomutase
VTNKTTLLRKIIQSNGTELLLEAHNGISATIVEEAGFPGIWASGLTISAQCGVRDSNELSWTQVLSVCELMSDATNIPILLDGDTGYGNFNNVRRLIKKLEQRNIAGVCLEDKLFPKTNSFIKGGTQPLASINEFSGKIRAAKDTQLDQDFMVVARVEALIAGHGMDESLERANAYSNAGADAILIHSALSDASEITSFAKKWNQSCPLVIVPTKYSTTPMSLFVEHNISVVIAANHLLRSAVKAMEFTARKLSKERQLSNIEDEIVSVQEIFRLQNVTELEAAEDRYL